MTTSLQIASREEENVRIINFIGDLTQSDEDLAKLILPSDRAVILNFTQVDYINSAGIAQLIRLVRQAQENRVTVLVHGVSPHYQKIFHMVGLTSYLYLYPDEKSALAAAGII